MINCEECKLEFPDHLVSAMAIGDEHGLKYRNVCPICALKIRSQITGVEHKNFSPGTVAQKRLEEARKFKKGVSNV